MELIIRSGQLPYSQSNEFTVLFPERVCMFDSYSIQFACGDRTWTDTVRFGRKGRGPGEVDEPGVLVAGPGRMLGHVAPISQRLTLFSPEFEFVKTVRLPFWLAPMGGIGEDSVLVARQIAMVNNSARIVWFSIALDSVVDDRVFQFDAGRVGMDTIALSRPEMTHGGEIVFQVGRDYLAWYNREGEFLELVNIPDFGTVYPSEREVEEWGAGITKLAAMAHKPPPTKEIEEFRHRPLGRIPRGVGFRVDRSDRLWVATTRPSQVGTHLAVFQRARYLGDIEISGRLLNFQIADSLLVALVEALEPDGDGLYPRRFDWYRILDR
jgi:hypothetical protein